MKFAKKRVFELVSSTTSVTSIKSYQSPTRDMAILWPVPGPKKNWRPPPPLPACRFLTPEVEALKSNDDCTFQRNVWTCIFHNSMINVSHIFWSVCKSALIYSVGLTWQQIYRIQNPHLQWSHLPLNIQAIIKEAPRWFTVFASFWAKAGTMTNFDEEKNY